MKQDNYSIDPQQFGEMKGQVKTILDFIQTFPGQLEKIHTRIDDHMEREEEEQKETNEKINDLIAKMNRIYWTITVIGALLAGIPLLREILPIILKGLIDPEELDGVITFLNIISIL